MRHPLSWRGRWTRTGLALVAGALLLRLAWGWYTGRLLARQLDEVRGRGEPAALSDVRFDLPDAQNAWAVQQSAIGALTAVYSPRASNDEYREYPPYPATWTKRAASSEATHGAAFALARQARALPRAQLRSAFASPGVSNYAFVTGLSSARHLANTLCDGGLYAHVRGDDAEAVERTLDAMHLSASLRQDPTIIGQLVGTGIEALALDNLQIITPELTIDGDTATTRPATLGAMAAAIMAGAARHPAKREQVRAAIAMLTDERLDWNGLRTGVTSERVIENDLMAWRTTRTWFTRPLADMESVRLNRRFDLYARAADLREKPAVDDMLRGVEPDRSVAQPTYPSRSGTKPPTVMPRYSHWFTMWDGDLSRYFLTHYRVIAERRMTAVILAVRLYRADHGGRWPERLADLAPAYLAGVPADPFQAGGRPLGYVVIARALPGGADRPLVFCDEVGAVVETPRDRPTYGWQQTSATGPSRPANIRQYRDLARFEPLGSAQAVDGDPGKPGAPGQ